MPTDQCTLIAADLRVPPCAQYRMYSVCFIVHSKHARAQLADTHISLARVDTGHTLEAGVFTLSHPRGDRSAPRHPSSVAPMQVTLGMMTASGTAAHTAPMCHCPQAHTPSHTEPSRGCPPPPSPQQPRALTPPGGTFLRESPATWLLLGRRKYPAHPSRQPLSGVPRVPGAEGGLPRAQSPGAKVLFAGTERKLHNLPWPAGVTRLIVSASPWLQAQARPLQEKERRASPLCPGLAAGGPSGLCASPVTWPHARGRGAQHLAPTCPLPDKAEGWPGVSRQAGGPGGPAPGLRLLSKPSSKERWRRSQMILMQRSRATLGVEGTQCLWVRTAFHPPRLT